MYIIAEEYHFQSIKSYKKNTVIKARLRQIKATVEKIGIKITC